jgi:hypothetical protein
MTAYDLFTEHQAKPVRAVQVTEENLRVLGTLPGINYRPETDYEEMWFGVSITEGYVQGIEVGDWILESAARGEWIVYWGDEQELDVFSDFPRFTDVFSSEPSSVDVSAAKLEALREALAAVNDEQLEDRTEEIDDMAYRSAINTAAERIEQLIQARHEEAAK